MNLNAEKVFILEDAINQTFNAALTADVVTESRVWRAMTDESVNTVHFAVKQVRDAARMAHDVFEEIFASVMAAAKREEEEPEGSSVLELIEADKAYWDDLYDRGVDAEHSGPHAAIMAARCSSFAEVRAKLAWLAAEGGMTIGIEDAMLLLAEDLDKIIAKQA